MALLTASHRVGEGKGAERTLRQPQCRVRVACSPGASITALALAAWRYSPRSGAPRRVGRMLRRPRLHAKNRREHGTAPGEFGYEASTAKASRQSPIIVRSGIDSVNLFRQKIYKAFVSVALKP